MSTSNIRSIIDPTDFSDSEAALDLYGNAVRESMPFDAFGDKTRFHARVLSIPIPMDSAGFGVDNAMGRPPPPGAAGSYLSKTIGYAFRARIVDDPSPHWFIPDPCNPEEAIASAEAQNLIMLHTKFIMSVSHISEVPNVGDYVMVELQKDTFAYNLRLGTALYKVDSRIYQSTLFGMTAGCASKCPDRRSPAHPALGQTATTPPSPQESYEAYPPVIPQQSTGEPIAIQVMRAKGFVVDDSGQINLIGIRLGGMPRDYASDSGLDKFVDRIQSIWFENGVWKVLSSPATTYPGVKPPSSGYRRTWGLEKGNRSVVGTGVLGSTVILLPGQHMKAYKWGPHSGRYHTMKQATGIPNVRDFDYNQVAGNESARTIDSSHYGLRVLNQDCATWKGGPGPCKAKDMVKFQRAQKKAQAALTKHGGSTEVWTKKSVGANIHASAYANTNPTPATVGRKAIGAYSKTAPIVGTAPWTTSAKTALGSMDKRSSRVGGWSAGCQVFKNYADWRAHIDAWSRSSQIYQQDKFNYTLMDSMDLQGGITAIDQDAPRFATV